MVTVEKSRSWVVFFLFRLWPERENVKMFKNNFSVGHSPLLNSRYSINADVICILILNINHTIYLFHSKKLKLLFKNVENENHSILLFIFCLPGIWFKLNNCNESKHHLPFLTLFLSRSLSPVNKYDHVTVFWYADFDGNCIEICIKMKTNSKIHLYWVI